MRAINGRNGRIIAAELQVAQTFRSRARGLLGRSGLGPGEGLLLRPCRGVHTFFMRFPIDVVFLDRSNRVLSTVQDLQPQRATRLLRHCGSVLELPAGSVLGSGTSPGDDIEIA